MHCLLHERGGLTINPASSELPRPLAPAPGLAVRVSEILCGYALDPDGIRGARHGARVLDLGRVGILPEKETRNVSN